MATGAAIRFQPNRNKYCFVILLSVFALINPLNASSQHISRVRPVEPSADSVSHAKRVELRASATSFEQLEAFGKSAQLSSEPDALSRLQHVTRIILNQGDFAAAENWNVYCVKNQRNGEVNSTRRLPTSMNSRSVILGIEAWL